MLDTLKGYDSEIAAGILADLILTIDSEAGEHNSKSKSPIDPEEQLRWRVLDEIYRRLNMSSAEVETTRGIANVYAVLGSEISRAALANANLEELKRRAGERGNLRPDLYKVTFNQQQRTVSKKHGIEPAIIKPLISKPDDFEHLLPEKFGFEEAVSLYEKTFEPSDTTNGFTVLVLTKRHGFEQNVLAIWRLQHEYVNLTEARTPLEMLLAFVNVYGSPITIGNRTDKFFLYERIRRPKDGTRLIAFSGKPIGTEELTSLFVKTTPDWIEVLLAYNIDEARYLSDLKKSGVLL